MGILGVLSMVHVCLRKEGRYLFVFYCLHPFAWPQSKRSMEDH